IVASPVVYGELIIAPSRERPMLALKAGGRGDVTKSHVLWSFGNGPDVPTPVTDGTYLYVINDRGIMWCLDPKTGKEIYGRQRPPPATHTRAPAAAAARDLQRIAGTGRRQDLRHERGWRHRRRESGPDVRAPGAQRFRRLHA